MPAKIGKTTGSALCGFNVPAKAIAHKDIIEKVYDNLAKLGLNVLEEEYMSTSTGKMAVGNYYLSDGKNNYMFTWSNTYDKSQKFKCSLGTFEGNLTGNVLEARYIFADENEYKTIKQGAVEIFHYINDTFRTLDSTKQYYDDFISTLTEYQLDKVDISSFIGRLFFMEEIITSSQLNNLKEKISKLDNMTIIDLYRYVSDSILDSHPSVWVDNYTNLQSFLYKEATILASRRSELEISEQKELEQVESNHVNIPQQDYISSLDKTVIFL